MVMEKIKASFATKKQKLKSFSAKLVPFKKRQPVQPQIVFELTLEEYCNFPSASESFYCAALDAFVPDKRFCKEGCGAIKGDYTFLYTIIQSPFYRGAVAVPSQPEVPVSHLTLRDMMSAFQKAMVRWTKKGFKVVSKEEYLRRRFICYQCSGSIFRCPFCGCMIWLKAALPKDVLQNEFCPLWESF